MADGKKHKDQSKKRMRIMLIVLAILFGGIFLYKGITSLLMRYGMSHASKVITVSTNTVHSSDWQSQLYSVGSIRAIRGVNVTTQLAGMVKSIFFIPGTIVTKGDILVELNTDADVAQLHALQASAELADITYHRDKKQLAAKAISQETLDIDIGNVKNLNAQVEQQAATVAKKILQAPFSGRLGISAVNPGQYLNPGDKVVTLQQLDPIYVDFYVPQQLVSQLKLGQSITLKSDSYPDKTFSGIITTIDPLVDVNTRNAEIEATIANSNFELLPGMFGNVTITTAHPQKFITLPQTAITFNPYGESVYLVIHEAKNKLTVKQVFVITGETRGDQITVLKGLKDGDEIVTSGQLKLKNGSEIAINNTTVPMNNPAPDLPNER